MNATRALYMAWPVSLLMLVLSCAACSASAPPADDSADTATQPAPAVAMPATVPPGQMPQTTPADPPAVEVAETATEPAGNPVPVAASAPLPSKPRPSISGKTPATRVPIPGAPMPGPPLPNPPVADSQAGAPVHLTINALSRGKGVPAETRDALKQIRSLLEQQQATAAVTAVQYKRIGIEGESRLCVEFRNARDAQAALVEIRRISAGVDLLEVVETPCPSTKEYSP